MVCIRDELRYLYRAMAHDFGQWTKTDGLGRQIYDYPGTAHLLNRSGAPANGPMFRPDSSSSDASNYGTSRDQTKTVATELSNNSGTSQDANVETGSVRSTSTKGSKGKAVATEERGARRSTRSTRNKAPRYT